MQHQIQPKQILIEFLLGQCQYHEIRTPRGTTPQGRQNGNYIITQAPDTSNNSHQAVLNYIEKNKITIKLQN